MKLSWWKALGGFFLAAALSLPVMGDNTALPGTLNYLEGQASIGTQQLTTKSVGSTDLQPGQTLATQNGRAELLLTPGVLLRLDHNSSVRMISPGLTNTQVELDRGRAEIEVAELHKENNLQVRQDDATISVQKEGLYEFSTDPNTVRVFEGEAQVVDGDHSIELKGGRELVLSGTAEAKAQKFDKDEAKDDFYNWSNFRSQYMSEASADAARIYVNSGWIGPGWYWDPWFYGYTFVPGAGIIYSPFGWGFYSPRVIYSRPFFYRPGPYYYGHGFTHFRPGFAHSPGIGPHFGGVHGFHGGGFHGGGRR